MKAKIVPMSARGEKVDLGSSDCPTTISWPLFSGSQDKSLKALCDEKQINRLNTLRHQAQLLRQDLINMAQAREAELLVGKEHPGVISGVQSYGFFVEIPPSMVEGLVHVSSLNDDWYEYRSRQNRLVGRKNRRVFQLGDLVNVKVLKVDVLRNQIDLEINRSVAESQTDGELEITQESKEADINKS